MTGMRQRDWLKVDLSAINWNIVLEYLITLPVEILRRNIRFYHAFNYSFSQSRRNIGVT